MFTPIFIYAQDEGEVKITGLCLKENLPVNNAEIFVTKNGEKIVETNSDKKGHFTVKLENGNDYRIDFRLPYCADMHMLVKGESVPKDKIDINCTFDINVVFFTKDDDRVVVDKFKEPFTIAVFDGKNKYVDDLNHLEKFKKGLWAEEENSKVNLVPKVKPNLLDSMINKESKLVGKIEVDDESDNINLSMIKVSITDKDGNVMKITTTNRLGNFIFDRIRPSDIAEIKIEESGTVKIMSNYRYKLLNSRNQLICDTLDASDGSKLFSLKGDKQKQSMLIDNYYTHKVFGQIDLPDSLTGRLLKKKIYLLNEEGKIIDAALINMFGGFVFTKIPTDQNYFIQLDEVEAGIHFPLKLFSASGILISTSQLVNKKHLFQFSSSDQATLNNFLIADNSIKMELKGKFFGDGLENPIRNQRIRVYDEKKKLINEFSTDEIGGFLANSIPFNSKIQFDFVDSTAIMSFKKILITDELGKIIKTIFVQKGKIFYFRFLPSDQNKLGTMYLEDPWLDLSNKLVNNSIGKSSKETIIENIYFDFNKAEILEPAKLILDKVFFLMKSYPNMMLSITAHTDSKGDATYNLKLSQKRAESAVKFLTDKGIDIKRLSSNGLGESKPLNKCKDGVVCTEEEYAQNRRLEFEIKTK